ncbi:hypothetical protein RFI_22209 [Reticulomyxa filosa]|uniref:L27 domain-containing protein n=1 Tax=Reticulomyxa filosa TaxID=46433 RepID=X6MMQ9_RETFI|nr:hypothetical protein RFI_22209 [Reticulomyxa filosa]|eukprot:ETO15154.1 hypothetical protein RFI_22209 [Reticulomyxa filosa]
MLQLEILANVLKVHDIISGKIYENLKKLYCGKEKDRILRINEMMECFTCEEPDCDIVNTLKCLSALTDKQINRDRPKAKVLMGQLLQNAKVNLSNEMYELIKERVSGKYGKDLIETRREDLLRVIDQVTEDPIARLLLQSMHNLNWEVKGFWNASCRLVGMTDEQLRQIINSEHSHNSDPLAQTRALRELLLLVIKNEDVASQSDLQLCVDILLPNNNNTIQQQSKTAIDSIEMWMQQKRCIDQCFCLHIAQCIAKTEQNTVDVQSICNHCINLCFKLKLISKKQYRLCRNIVNDTSHEGRARAILDLSTQLKSRDFIAYLVEE